MDEGHAMGVVTLDLAETFDSADRKLLNTGARVAGAYVGVDFPNNQAVQNSVPSCTVICPMQPSSISELLLRQVFSRAP